MIEPGRARELRKEAVRLAERLSRFKTPRSNEPVDPARLGAVAQAARRAASLDEVAELVMLMPRSAMRRLSRSAPPQLEEVRKRVEPLVEKARSTEELAYLLSWARRILFAREKGVEL